MKRSVCLTFLLLFGSVVPASVALAKGAGSSGGLTLMQAPGARASSLGEAYVSSLDDIAGFAYNPSSLKSLSSGQASFLYQQGLADDAFSQLIICRYGPGP